MYETNPKNTRASPIAYLVVVHSGAGREENLFWKCLLISDAIEKAFRALPEARHHIDLYFSQSTHNQLPILPLQVVSRNGSNLSCHVNLTRPIKADVTHNPNCSIILSFLHKFHKPGLVFGTDLTNMAPLATVGILSIGDMGMGIAKLLIAHNYRVVTNLDGRR